MDLFENDILSAQVASGRDNETGVNLTKNQNNIQLIANDLLSHTKPLDAFEQEVLNKTYARSLKSVPSRSY